MKRFCLLAAVAGIALTACGNEAGPPADDVSAGSDSMETPAPDSTGTTGTPSPVTLTVDDATAHLSNGTATAEDGSYITVSGDFTESLPGGNADGLVFMLTEEQIEAFSGHLTTITINARGGDFKVAWSTRGTGNSGWNEFSGSEDWTESSFQYAVPEQTDGNRDVIGIIAASPDSPVEVASVTITAE